MRKVKVSEIVKLTGLSRATVDRVINQRGGVHQRSVNLVNAAVAKLTEADVSYPTDIIDASEPQVDVLLRVDTPFFNVISEAIASRSSSNYRLLNLDQANEKEVIRQISEACKKTSTPLLLCVKNTKKTTDILSHARKKGKRVITLFSDICENSRDTYIGLDNRAAGQCAALLIGRSLQNLENPEIVVILGDHSFLCHEDREIGFRTTLRQLFPNIRISQEIYGEDNDQKTYESLSNLLSKTNNVRGIYNLSGGNSGLARAVEEFNQQSNITIITHEINEITRPLLASGTIDFILNLNTDQLLKSISKELNNERSRKEKIDLNIHCQFNIPVKKQ